MLNQVKLPVQQVIKNPFRRVTTVFCLVQDCFNVVLNYRPLDRAFDYFENNWNVVGLKDYKFGSRITPNNELVLAGKTPVEIRIGADRTPLSRENAKLAMDGWMPIILVTIGGKIGFAASPSFAFVDPASTSGKACMKR